MFALQITTISLSYKIYVQQNAYKLVFKQKQGSCIFHAVRSCDADW
jgi:hypothetical protein